MGITPEPQMGFSWDSTWFHRILPCTIHNINIGRLYPKLPQSSWKNSLMPLWFATSSTIFHRTWSIVLCNNTWISVVSLYKMGWFRSRAFVWNPPGVLMWARWFSPGVSIIINHQPSILITTTISIINQHRKKCLKKKSIHLGSRMIEMSPCLFQHVFWLVVYLPLWKIWIRQLGWWHSQYMEK